MIGSYSKVYGFGHRAIADLLKDKVTVEEKIDGSQFSFCKIDGELHCRSHGKQIVLDAPEKMFRKAIETIQDIKDNLTSGLIYRGEFLSKPCHNSLAYDRVPQKNIIIYDIDEGQQNYLCYEAKKVEAERIGLEVVPLLRRGLIENAAEIYELLETTSTLGGQKIEGFVIKNYNRFTIDGKTMMGKYVSEHFKEVHKKSWGERNPTQKNIIDQIVADHKTEARWDKAIQHLKEEGKIEDDPKDIGALLKEISKDVHDECGDEIKERLFKHFWKEISRAIIRGFPEHYKKKLMEKQFDENRTV